MSHDNIGTKLVDWGRNIDVASLLPLARYILVIHLVPVIEIISLLVKLVCFCGPIHLFRCFNMTWGYFEHQDYK